MHGRQQQATQRVHNADSLHHHLGGWSDIRMTCVRNLSHSTGTGNTAV